MTMKIYFIKIIMYALKKVGCEVIHFGVESGSQEIIKKIGKNINLSWAKEIMCYANKQNIHVVASFIIGHLACAFSYDSKLLILDEPTSGLDPVSRDELLEIIEKYVPNKGKHSISGKKRLRLGAFFPWCYQLIFEKDEKENVLYEYKFYRVPLETKAQGSNVDCKDDFYMVKDFLLSMTDNDWKFKQIVIPFDEKKGIYCTLGYEVIFERKK